MKVAKFDIIWDILYYPACFFCWLFNLYEEDTKELKASEGDKSGKR